MTFCGALKDPLLVKKVGVGALCEKASMYTRFFESVGLRRMDISNMAQAGAL